MPSQQRREKTDGEMVAVGAQIENIPPIGKERRQLRDVPQEPLHAYAAPVTVSEHRIIAVPRIRGRAGTFTG